jgi:glycosyltransferase involved in cell wall biosynthesis
MKTDPAAAPDILIESSALYPPMSGVGYYTRELLKAYSRLPGCFPMKLLAYRFFLKPRSSPQDEYLAGLAREIGAEVEVRSRMAPSAVHRRLRGRALRSPFPVDAAAGGSGRIYFFPNYVGAPLLRAACVPVVYDLGFLHHPETFRARDHVFLRRYLPRTLRRAAAIVVISESIKRELMDAFALDAERIAVIHPAADPAAFRPDLPPDAGPAVRAKYGLDGPYLFSLSTLEPRKNFSGLVGAYALLPEDVKARMPLVVAGGQGWKNDPLFDAVRRLNLESRIKFLGYIPEADRAPLMREAELFALPSLYEGFGMPVLEAMACGTPVVTSGRGALAEVGADAVVYADPLDPRSIARAMMSVIGDPDARRRLAAAGPRRAAAFRWETGARTLAGVFERAAREIR